MPQPAPESVNRLTGETVKSISRLAEILCISRPTVYEWLDRTGCPGKDADGTFNVQQWRAFARGQGSKSTAGASDDKNALQCEELRLKNEQLQFKLDVQRGRYTENGAIAEQIAEIVNEAKSVLRNKLEQELPAQLVGLTLADIRAALKAAVVEVCERLSQPPPCVAATAAAQVQEDSPGE